MHTESLYKQQLPLSSHRSFTISKILEFSLLSADFQEKSIIHFQEYFIYSLHQILSSLNATYNFHMVIICIAKL